MSHGALHLFPPGCKEYNFTLAEDSCTRTYQSQLLIPSASSKHSAVHLSLTSAP